MNARGGILSSRRLQELLNCAQTLSFQRARAKECQGGGGQVDLGKTGLRADLMGKGKVEGRPYMSPGADPGVRLGTSFDRWIWWIQRVAIISFMRPGQAKDIGTRADYVLLSINHNMWQWS